MIPERCICIDILPRRGDEGVPPSIIMCQVSRKALVEVSPDFYRTTDEVD